MHEFLPISLHSHWEADEQLTEMLWNLRRVTWSELHDYHIHVDGVDRLDLADDEKPLLYRIFISRIVAFYLTIFKLVYFLSLEHWFADTTLYVPFFFYRMSRYYSSHAFYVFVVGKLHVCAGQNLAFYYWPRAKVVQLRVCNFSCQTMPEYTKTRHHHKYRQRN